MHAVACVKMASSKIILVKKPKAVSVVWNYFGLRADSDGQVLVEESDLPVCKECYKDVPAKSGNTSNLLVHLRDHHPMKYAEAYPKIAKGMKGRSKVDSRSQPTLEQTYERTTKYSSQSPTAIELNSAVMHFVAKDMRPLSIVDKPGFQHTCMVSKLNPRYQLPSRKHFSEYELPKLYNHVRDVVVMPKLKEATYFAGTCDFWTSPASIPYLTFTVHFVDKAWNLQSFSLSTSPLYEDHTGRNIADALLDILANWELLPENLIATTTDNGANIVNAFKILKWIRLSCFGHNLDLAVNKALKCDGVESALAKCRRLVELFHRSWKKSLDLAKKQELLGLPTHKLIGSVLTRWGSVYATVERIVEQQQAICGVLIADRKNRHLMPSDATFSVLEIIIKVLKPVTILTDALSGEKHVTISSLLTITQHVEQSMTVSTDDTSLEVEMKTALLQDLKKRNISCDVEKLIQVTSFLDPRFKDAHLDTLSKEIVLSSIREECLLLILANATPESDYISVPDEDEGPPTKRLKGLAAVLNQIVSQQVSRPRMVAVTPEEKAENEIGSYLEFPVAAIDTDPLQWWKKEEGRFPNLAQLAKKYLCVCGTSVPSERIFSKAGYINDHLRSRLDPKNVDKLVFLSVNML